MKYTILAILLATASPALAGKAPVKPLADINAPVCVKVEKGVKCFK